MHTMPAAPVTAVNCSATVRAFGRPCHHRAVVEVEGRPFCGRHRPRQTVPGDFGYQRVPVDFIPREKPAPPAMSDDERLALILEDMHRVTGENVLGDLGIDGADQELVTIAGQVLMDPEGAYAALHALLRRRLGRVPATRMNWAIIVERTHDDIERLIREPYAVPSQTATDRCAEKYGTSGGQLRNWWSAYRWLPMWAIELARKGTLSYTGALEITSLRRCGYDYAVMTAILERLRETVPNIPLQYGVIPARHLRLAVRQAVAYVATRS